METDKKLYFRETYPKVYTPTQDFKIGNGWFQLLDQFGLISTLLKKEQEKEKFFVLNVQEKFGILFIDYEGADFLLSSLISSTERLSHRICEDCGNNGTLHSSNRRTSFGKLATLCDKHALKKLYWKV